VQELQRLPQSENYLQPVSWLKLDATKNATPGAAFLVAVNISAIILQM
jgi:hypothetical protein